MYGFSGDASTSSPMSAVTFPASSTVSNAGSGAPGTMPISASGAASSVGSLAGTAAGANTALGGSATASAGLNAAGSLVGAGVGAYSGFQGVLSGFEAGSAGGVLSATMGGAQLGGAIGSLAGPLGTAIGAGIGAAAGAVVGIVGDITGEGNRLGAASYYKQTMLPQFEKAAQDYFNGTSSSSEAALGQVASIAQAGDRAIAAKFGGTAASWVRSQYTDKEEAEVAREINQLAAGGHDYVKTSAVQFHTGGFFGGFGDLSTSSSEGFIHAMLGEAVVNPVAAATHSPYIGAMNAGASESEIAGMYLRNSSRDGAGASASGGDTHHHWNVQTMDAHSFKQFLSERGGMDAIVSANTKRNSLYNGEAD